MVPRRVEAEDPRSASHVVVVGRVALQPLPALAALLELVARDPQTPTNHPQLADDGAFSVRVVELASDDEIASEPPQRIVSDSRFELGSHDLQLGACETAASLPRAPVRLEDLELLDESRRVLDEHRRRQRTSGVGRTELVRAR